MDSFLILIATLVMAMSMLSIALLWGQRRRARRDHLPVPLLADNLVPIGLLCLGASFLLHKRGGDNAVIRYLRTVLTAVSLLLACYALIRSWRMRRRAEKAKSGGA